ncbi:PASTA domain-containing protein [Pseudonocardia hispaniensis]
MRRAATLTLLTAVSAALLTACGGTEPETPSPATVTVQVPAPAQPAAAQPVAPSTVTLPDVVGQNGAIAKETLEGLGLTNIRLAADPKSGKSAVFLPENWHVTKLEPKAGTEVRTDQTVVLTMTK